MALLLALGCNPGTIALGPSDKPIGTDTDLDSGTDTVTTDTGDSAGTTTPPIPVVIPDWVVDCTGAADFRFIQEAIDAAVSGDVIAVEPCDYHERLDLRGKNLDIYSTGGSTVTTLDADYGGTAINVENGEGDATRIAGFSVEDGQDTDYGAGSAVEVSYANLQLEDMRFVGNGPGWSVIYALNGFVDLADVTISDSPAAPDGAAIYSDGGGITAVGLDVDCGGGLAAVWHHNATRIDQSRLRCTTGYGIYGYHPELSLHRSRVEGLVAAVYAEDEDDNPSERVLVGNSLLMGDVAFDARYVHYEVVNSVLAGGTAGLYVLADDSGSVLNSSVVTGAVCGVQGDEGTVSIRYTDFWDNATDLCSAKGRVTLDADPMFRSWPDDLHLDAASPLVDAGDPALDDADGSRNDIGVYGGPAGSW